MMKKPDTELVLEWQWRSSLDSIADKLEGMSSVMYDHGDNLTGSEVRGMAVELRKISKEALLLNDADEEI